MGNHSPTPAPFRPSTVEGAESKLAATRHELQQSFDGELWDSLANVIYSYDDQTSTIPTSSGGYAFITVDFEMPVAGRIESYGKIKVGWDGTNEISVRLTAIVVPRNSPFPTPVFEVDHLHEQANGASERTVQGSYSPDVAAGKWTLYFVASNESPIQSFDATMLHAHVRRGRKP